MKHRRILFSPNPFPLFFPFSDKGPVQEQRWKTKKTKPKQNKTKLYKTVTAKKPPPPFP